MCQACGLYELRQYGVTCVQAPRCHHIATTQCFAQTHSKKKNPCAFCARKTIFYNSTDKFLKKQLLRLWQCRGDTFRTDPLSVQSYRVCQKVSLTVAYLLAMFIISQVVSLSCLLTINFMCQQRFFGFRKTGCASA